MNIRLLIEYDGTDFSGWQRQPHKPSIQETIEKILYKMTRERITVQGSGRTDSGVHARGQVANFHTRSTRAATTWREILNHHLPKSVRVLKSEEAPESFHSLKSATGKIYEYRILNRAVASALHRNSYHFSRPLNWQAIQKASKHFEGTHDFKSLQGARATVKTTTRTIHSIHIQDEGDGFFVIRVYATGFLKQMMRTLVGTLLKVGEGKTSPDEIPEILSKKDRRAAGPTVPSIGLFLHRVLY